MKIFWQSGKLVPTTRRSDNIQLVQSWFVTQTKKLEEVYFVDEEFLQKKVNKNGVYMRIMVRYRRYSSLRQALWKFDSVELKEMTKVLQLCCS